MGYHGEPVLDGDLVEIVRTGDAWEGCWGVVDVELSVDVTNWPIMAALRPTDRGGKPWPDGSNYKALKVVFLRLKERILDEPVVVAG